MADRTRTPRRLGIVPWEHRAMDDTPALRTTVKLLRERYDPRPCDSEAVASCERCNVMFLVDRVEYALNASKQEVIPASESNDG